MPYVPSRPVRRRRQRLCLRPARDIFTYNGCSRHVFPRRRHHDGRLQHAPRRRNCRHRVRDEKSDTPSFSDSRKFRSLFDGFPFFRSRGKIIDLHAADERRIIALSNGYRMERAVDAALPMWRLLRSGVGDKPFVDNLRLHAGLLSCDLNDVDWNGNIYVLAGAGLRLRGDRNTFRGSWKVSENACLPVSKIRFPRNRDSSASMRRISEKASNQWQPME